MQRGARVLVPAGSSASAAAKRQTSTIPIIFISVGDPVGIGIVESLPHPGGNATGFTDVLADLSSKFIEFARELGTRGVPVGYLWHNKWPDGQHRLVATEQAAQAAGVLLRSRGISDKKMAPCGAILRVNSRIQDLALVPAILFVGECLITTFLPLWEA
jgi:ABC-type uncharacterized transport system substrate-binding protein